jgi:threonine aldolase
LSKGLGAPIGSMLLGDKKFIERARSTRKALGGGMRQVGIIAAAGIIALEKMTKRLGEDHEHAKFLARGLAQLPGIKIDPARVQTNIVIFEITREGLYGAEVTQRLGEQNVLAGSVGTRSVRFVTHMDVGRADCARAIDAMKHILSAATTHA